MNVPPGVIHILPNQTSPPIVLSAISSPHHPFHSIPARLSNLFRTRSGVVLSRNYINCKTPYISLPVTIPDRLGHVPFSFFFEDWAPASCRGQKRSLWQRHTTWGGFVNAARGGWAIAELRPFPITPRRATQTSAERFGCINVWLSN